MRARFVCAGDDDRVEGVCGVGVRALAANSLCVSRRQMRGSHILQYAHVHVPLTARVAHGIRADCPALAVRAAGPALAGRAAGPALGASAAVQPAVQFAAVQQVSRVCA